MQTNRADKNIAEIGIKENNTNIGLPIDKDGNNNQIANFGLGNAEELRKVTFQLSSKAIEKACLDVTTNGFSFEQVQDNSYAVESSLTTDSNNHVNLDKYKDLKHKRERLGDLKSVLYTNAIQNLSNIDTFVSISDIVMRCFIKTDNKYINDNPNYVYYNETTGKSTVFYAFVFSGCITNNEGKRRVIQPKSRVTLLGIQPIMRVENKTTKSVEYHGYLSGYHYIFDESLVFVTNYATYHELFESIFQLQAVLLGSITKDMQINNILHVTSVSSSYFSLNEAAKREINQTFSNLLNGKSDGIITTSNYTMQVHSIKETGTTQQTGLNAFGNAIGFITGMPQSILFGTEQKTWSRTGEEDRIKYEFFLKMLAEVYFLPILQQFCKLFALEGWEKLEYKTTALIREKINIFNTEVPEELKTDERLYYIGLEVDKLLGIDSKTKADLKKQLEVEEDSNKDIKKKPNNSKNSNKSSQKNSK